METGMWFGNKIDMKEAAGPVADAVVKVLQAIADGRHDRETAMKALEVIGQTAGVNVSAIKDCHITGDTHHHYPLEPGEKPINPEKLDFKL